MRTRRIRSGRGGFSRAELLVVLGVAAIVLPLAAVAVQEASEEAQIARCLANLGGVMRATHLYLEDYEQEFPLYVSYGGPWFTWAYGGKTNDSYWTPGGGFYAPISERPVNSYVLGAAPEPDVVVDGQVVERTPMPQFQCPSDARTHQRHYTEPNGGADLISSYDDVGTSYQSNIHAVLDAKLEGQGGSEDVTGLLMRTLAREAMATQTETLLWLTEDPLDFAFRDYTLEIGQHGRLGWYSGGYFDGHADYRYMDTRRWCGPGWAAINPRWVKSSYPIGTKVPIYYILALKTCNP